MSKIDKAIRIHVPNQNWILEHGDYASISVYSSTDDMKNDQYSNEYIQVKAEVNGVVTNCYVAVASSQNEAYEAQYSGWTINDNGVEKYVLFEPYLPEAVEPEPDPEPEHTYTYEAIATYYPVTYNTSTSRPSSSPNYKDDPWGQIPNLDQYRTVYKVTRDDGEVRYCTQESWNAPIADGWWYEDYVAANGINGENHYIWEVSHCHKYVDGEQGDSAAYEIIDEHDLFDYDGQDELPNASKQTLRRE